MTRGTLADRVPESHTEDRTESGKTRVLWAAPHPSRSQTPIMLNEGPGAIHWRVHYMYLRQTYLGVQESQDRKRSKSSPGFHVQVNDPSTLLQRRPLLGILSTSSGLHTPS